MNVNTSSAHWDKIKSIMIKHRRELRDGEMGAGSVNSVQRLGDTIVRPVGEWSASVHGLLDHLKTVNFNRAPQVLGAESNKEILSYIDGEVAMRPWPSCLLNETGIVEIAQMLREYHGAVGDYCPGINSKWRNPSAKWQEGMIIRHGDLGPWNMVWKADKLVGLIDWDLAEPGDEMDDIAQIAWYCIPIRPENQCLEAGIDMTQQTSRLNALCDVLSVKIDEVIDALAKLQSREIKITVELGTAGVEPWKTFLERGDAEDIEAERQWLFTTHMT